MFASVDRVIYPARGSHRGQSGACGHLALENGTILKGKGKQLIPSGEVLVFQTPGGGGYGAAHTRSVSSVVADVSSKLVSPAAAKRDYGVVFRADGTVDRVATRQKRKTLAKATGKKHA